MVSKSICLIDTHPGKEDDVIKYLKRIEGVKAYRTYGPYDIIAEVCKENLNEVKRTVERQIEKIEGVEKVSKQFVIGGFTRDKKGNIKDYKLSNNP